MISRVEVFKLKQKYCNEAIVVNASPRVEVLFVSSYFNGQNRLHDLHACGGMPKRI